MHDKAKAKAPTMEKKEVKVDQAPRPWRDFFPQVQRLRSEMVSLLYKEPVYRIMEMLKRKPYFHWPNKMRRDVTRRN